MYSNLIYNNSVFCLLLLICLFAVSPQLAQNQDESAANAPVQKSDAKTESISANEDDEEFPQLLHMIDATQRVHIVSEVAHDDFRLQVEEYLDLSTFSQLIQFKRHQGPTGGVDRDDAKFQRLKTIKFNTLLVNSQSKSLLYYYEPYQCAVCDISKLNDSNSVQSLAWTIIENNKPTSSERDAQTSLHSYYLTKLEETPQNLKKPAKWVSGIAGLWLKAQVSSRLKPPYHPDYVMNGNMTKMKGLWRLELDSELMIDFYVNKLAARGSKSIKSSDAPTMIVLKNRRTNKTIQTINLFEIEFNYSDQLDKNLFTLPIGFNCPSNLNENVAYGVYFNDQRSQLMSLELVATRFDQVDPSKHKTDVKNIQLARARHPIDKLGTLNMFRSLEDRFKIVQDNSLKLEYNIHNLGLTRHCSIQHLQFVEPVARNYSNSSKLTRPASINPIRLEFNNGIHLDLSEFNMDLVLGLHEIDQSQMRLLNVFDVSDAKGELVYEAEVLDEHHKQLISFVATQQIDQSSVLDDDGTSSKFKLRIVRVFEQELTRSKVGEHDFKVRRGLVDFSRAIIMVFDAKANRRLAEIRVNLVEDTHVVSYARRAKLFDLSQCHDLEQESMQLVAYYPAEPQLLRSIGDQSHEILDGFYRSSFDYLSGPVGNLSIGDENQLMVSQKRRLGASLNFLRVPRVELKMGATRELELHMTILERNSPLDLFEHLPNSHFIENHSTSSMSLLFVGSLHDCATRCRQYNCKVFAHQAGSKQCKLSKLPLSQQSSGTNENDQVQRQTVQLVMSPNSDVYFEPEFIAQRHLDEASLLELSSYIEHIYEELDNFMLRNSDGYDEDNNVGQGASQQNQTSSGHQLTEAISSSPFTSRQKRSATPLEQPLFVFDFLDRSGQRNDYDPPRKRSLVPSELVVERMPSALDVAALAQANRVARTFHIKYTGKTYKLAALDDSSTRANLNGNLLAMAVKIERVFRDKHNEVYYTLRKISSITNDNCALLCYNLDEIDFRRENSEQICLSYSFSAIDDVCTLLIRTDFKFVESVLDLNVQEGDLVLEVQRPEDLLVTSFDGNVLTRRYLASFEGPFELNEAQVGQRFLDGIQIEALQLEWLPALEIESNLVEDDHGEQCAQECARRNRRGSGLCLAFDHCFASQIRLQTSSELKSRLECKLLLVKNEFKTMRSEAQIRQINRLRSFLSQTAASNEQSIGDFEHVPDSRGATKSVKSRLCSRYLVSHLSEFNHLNKRQINQSNQLIKNKLTPFSETLLETDQNSCAMECSLEPALCLVFEFCQQVDSRTQRIEQRCTLFKRTSVRGPVDLEVGVESNSDDHEEKDQFKQITSYHEGCQLFLRREFDSLETALSDRALDKMEARRQSGPGGFQHGLLAVCFSLVYLAIAVGAAVLCLMDVRANKANPRGRSLAPVSIPMRPLRSVE